MRFLSSISLFFLVLLVGCGQGETATAPNDDEPVCVEPTEPNDIDEDIADPNTDAQQNMMEFGSLIEPGNVGEISVGMLIEEVREVFGYDKVRDAQRTDEGETYEIHYVYDDDNQVIFEVTPHCESKCSVDRILVLTEDYKTVQGLGVGNTFADIEAAHTGLDIFAGGFGIMVYTKELQKVAYVLQVDGLNFEPNQEFSPSEILDDSKVIAVYTF